MGVTFCRCPPSSDSAAAAFEFELRMVSIRDAFKRESLLQYSGDEIVSGQGVRAERTDAQLIELILAGDQTAFEQLFNRHKRLVARTAARYFQRHEQIEEIIQISFAKTYLELAKFRGEHSFSFHSWIGRITANACLDTIRSNNRKPEELQCELSENEAQSVLDLTANTDESPEDSIVNRDLTNKLLSRLPTEDRALLHMIYVDEMSIAEIGSFFGWSISKVKIRAWRARNNLRKVLKRYL